MKKTISLLLALAMTLTLCCPAFAASLPELTYDLSCDGAAAHTLPSGGTENALEYVETGDEITVYFTISAASTTNVGVTWNEVYYDHSFFELVGDSASAEAAFSSINVVPQIRSGNRHFVFFNTSTTYTYGEAQRIGSFTLKVIAAGGESVISNTSYSASQNMDKYSITAHDLWVGFGEWDGATFQVTLDVGDGTLPSGASAVNSVNTEKNEKLTLPTPTRQFYTFDYWTDGSRQYSAGAQFTPTEHTTLTAHWTPVPKPAAPTGFGTVKASIAGAADGKITGVTTAMEYTASKVNAPTACTGTTINGLKAGTYYVRLKANPATNTPAGEYASVSVESWPLRAAPTGLSSVKASSATAEDGKIIGTTTDMEYSRTPDDPESFKKCSATETTGLKPGVYFVRFVFDKVNNKAPSAAAQVSVLIDAPPAPTGLEAVKPSLLGKNDGKITNVTVKMEYSTDPDFETATPCPDKEITGLAAGTYYIRLKADPSTNTPAGNYAAIEVEAGPAPSGGTSKPAGSGSSDLTVKATVSKDAVATVSAVSDDAIKAAAKSESGVVGIDLSEGDEAVESAKLPSGMIGKIASAVNANGKGGFALKLTSANLEFDMKALQSLASQAKSGALQIDMRDTGTMALNAAQYEAVKGMSVFGGYNVSAAVGKQNISEFNGGNIRIGIPFNIPSGRYAEGFSAYYVAPDGKLTRLATTYDGGMLNFTVNHFSDYIIAYSEQPDFTDVVPGSYYENAVAWAVSRGITTGTSTTTFSPDAGTTRAQVVTFLWRAMGSPEPKSDAGKFTDLLAGEYYVKAVAWAVEQGITNGMTDTTFAPDAVCTRAQIVTFLWRTMGKPVVNYAISFSDVAADYYTEAVRWAVSKDITSGTTPTTFSPNATCTRAQVVTFLWRCMK